jgi:adenine-specific DNA-methyltransferase
MKEKTYKISEVAEILGVHPDTIRNWEDEGLIIPDRIGTRGDRRYTIAHIKEIKDKNLISSLAKKNFKNKDYSNLSKEELIKEIQILNKQKTFGLVYEDKKEEIVEECKNKAPILKPVSGYRIEDKKGDQKKPKHILIQGDNYHALKVLNYTHKNKIDVIYIDPPYNTGNKDFIYNDSFVDKEDSYRHSKWISFMEKRLVLAKELLKDSGVIFISIDDNEQARLKLLCDEIFGEDNFIDCIVWDKKSSAKGVPPVNMIVNVHEYIITYQNHGGFKFLGEKRTEESGKFKNPDNDPRGPWRESNIKSTIKSSDQAFTIVDPNTGKKYHNTWAFSKESLDKMIKENRILWKDSLPKQKEFMNEMKNENMAIKSNWGVFDPQSTTVFLKTLLPNEKFDNPKPIKLTEYLMRVASKKDSVVLDFFAGSGTTGHAILELNKDGGGRQVILCTNNENGIAEKVTYQRMKKIMKGYEKVEGLGGELEYFETELVDVENMERVNDKKKLAFTLEAGWVIATKENTFNEIEKNDSYQIFEGIENVKGKNINKTVAIYFKENLDKLKELENKILKKENVKLYIFSHYTNEFSSEYADCKNIKVCDIPEPILKVYRGFNNN